MSIIAIKDLSEDKTLDRAAMSELHGGKLEHCPKDESRSYSPNAGPGDSSGLHFLESAQPGAGISRQLGDFATNVGIICIPSSLGQGKNE